jgi:hypothetical protein
VGRTVGSDHPEVPHRFVFEDIEAHPPINYGVAIWGDLGVRHILQLEYIHIGKNGMLGTGRGKRECQKKEGEY